MPELQSCPYVDDADIDHRYLGGTLSESQAEEFERHYFECELCWTRVRRGAEIRTSLPEPQSSEPEPRSSESARSSASVPKRRAFIRWGTRLAAAAVLLIAAGLWRDRSDRFSRERALRVSSPIEPMRGSNTSLTVSSHATKNVLAAVWSRPRQATSYRVRLLAADGALLFERETTDTSIVLPSDSARISVQSASGYWEVQALDELRKIVATSQLTPVRAPKDSP